MTKIIVEDEQHAELQGEFSSIEAAIAELNRRVHIPWNEEPNVAPCMSWQTCRRRYEIVEYDDAQTPWKEIGRTPVLEVSAAGINWSEGFGSK